MATAARRRRLSLLVPRRCYLPQAATKVVRGAKYELLPVQPMEIRYDAEEEVPILVRAATAGISLHISNLAHYGTRHLLYDDVSKYFVGNVLKELFYRVKNAGPDKELYFADPHDYKSVAKTFEWFGSLFTYTLGTCCIKNEKYGELRVVVDTGVWKTIEKDTEGLYGYSGRERYVKPTGYRMFSIPRIVFVHDAFKVVNHDLQIRYAAFARKESERRNMDLFDADQMASQLKIKVAVEVEQSSVGKGNFVFFMDSERAKDPAKVFAELKKHVDLNSGLTVVPYASHLREKHILSFSVVA